MSSLLSFATPVKRAVALIVLLTAAAPSLGSAALAQGSAPMNVKTEDGSMFMEEIKSDRPDAQNSTTAPRVEMKRPVNLQELNIPVNSNGHIVPLIDRGNAGGVMELGTQSSVSFEPLPYGYYGPYVMNRVGPYAAPGYYPNGYVGPYYSPLNPWYTGSPYAGYGYGPAAAGVNLKIGNVGVSVGAGGYLPGYSLNPWFGGGYPYIPTTYSSNGMGSFNYSSTSSGYVLPFGF